MESVNVGGTNNVINGESMVLISSHVLLKCCYDFNVSKGARRALLLIASIQCRILMF